jgi:hypothetical protein
MVIVEKLVEWRLAGETEVLGENLLQSHFVHRKSHMNNFFKFVRWDFGYCGHYWPIVPAPDDRWGWLWRNWWNEDWQGKPKYSEKKTFPSATLSTTNPIWLNPGLIPGRRGWKPATNRLSYGANKPISMYMIYNHIYMHVYINKCLFFSELRSNLMTLKQLLNL